MRLGFLGFIVLVAIFGVGIGGAYAAGNIAGRAAVQSTTRTAATTGNSNSGGATNGAAPDGTSTAGGFGGNRAGGPNGGGANGAGFAGRAVTGTVDSVDNGKISVSTPQGQTETLSVADNVQVQKSSPAALSDVTKGARVLVTTRAGQNGELSAVSIQILPSN